MLGFIGAGNMAQAIIRGAVSARFCPAEEIMAFDTDTSKVRSLSEQYVICAAESAVQLAKDCETVVLAVKPNALEQVLNEIRGVASDNLIVSIAAGKQLSFYEKILGTSSRIVRVMPNINAVVGEAISAFCANKNAADNDKELVKALLGSFGEYIELPEERFSIFSAIGGCSPAFAYMFIDAMARAAVKNGMSKQDALRVSAQAVLGSARMILESENHPWELVDRVCSPGGTTIEGVAALEECGFQAAVAAAVEASFNKDKRL